jgi:multisubunit Na+/H+ antiporter MnhG subunit
VPFYICGGAVAVWAVLLAAIGLNRPDFPTNLAGQRGVIAISFVLIVLAIGAAILTA